MAGLGRRTHYRKHLTDSVLNDLPEPKDDERIAKVVSTRGGNQFDIVLANTTTTKRDPQLAILPTKFHKLVWVKRNDYVIVQTGIDDEDEFDGRKDGDQKDSQDGEGSSQPLNASSNKQDGINDGIRYIITHILYKDQIKHLKSKNLWPTDDPEFGSDGNDGAADNDEGEPHENDDGIVYANNYYDDDEDEEGGTMDDDLFVNTNRMARVEIEDSDDESSDEED